jgi:predicted Rossmann fold flavoprotein
MVDVDVMVIGAGAAGLMCASEAGKRGRRVLLSDHARKLGEKIRISGGGRCNFTNLYTAPEAFLSANPHFCKSALRQYDQYDFISLINKREDGFHITLDVGVVKARSLVIATGGLSIPKIGATGFGYQIARQFKINVLNQRPGLVPLVFDKGPLARCKRLSGLSLDAQVACVGTAFQEGLLFTHRGLSGPSILQISSYWRDSHSVSVDLSPGHDIIAHLINGKARQPRRGVATCLADILPKRLAAELCDLVGVFGRLADRSDRDLRKLGQLVNDWRLTPNGTEGYRTAEVTLGGVDTNEISSKTMEAKAVPGLYFTGEVVDVTGHLGGYNFQWAWSSGFVAGQYA